MTLGKNLTIWKIVALVLLVACFVMLFLPWISTKALYNTETFNVFSTAASNYGSFWSVMLIIFAILFILCFFLAIFGILSDRSTLALPVGILAFLMFFFCIFQMAFINSEVKSQASALMMSALGGAYGSGVGMMLSSAIEVHVGVGAWLFFFFGLAVVGLLIVDRVTQGRKPVDFGDFSLAGASIPSVSLGGWTCPTCGVSLSGSQKFCVQCGTPKPEAPRCPGCGKLIKPGMAFCTNCGTRLG